MIHKLSGSVYFFSSGLRLSHKMSDKITTWGTIGSWLGSIAASCGCVSGGYSVVLEEPHTEPNLLHSSLRFDCLDGSPRLNHGPVPSQAELRLSQDMPPLVPLHLLACLAQFLALAVAVGFALVRLHHRDALPLRRSRVQNLKASLSGYKRAPSRAHFSQASTDIQSLPY